MVGIIVFTSMVGWTPSATRGACAAIAILTVGLLGRAASSLRTLLLVVTGMVVLHPHILGFDLGFQLTIAATTAILLVAPIAARRFPSRHPLLSELRDLMAASIAATLATAPILAAAFGTAALLGPLVGMVILPMSTACIILTVLLLVIVAGIPALAPPCAWLVVAFGDAIAGVVRAAAALPWAQIVVPRPDPWFVIAMLVLAGVAMVPWYRRRGIPLFLPSIASDDRPANMRFPYMG
jgi:competence protein ComEC